MSYKSFPEINAYVQQRITDAKLCASGTHSYLKVFQHALSYALNGWTRLILPTKWHHSLWWLLLYHTVKGLRGKNAPRVLNEIVIIDQGRIYKTASGDIQSQYFHKIKQTLGAARVTTINLAPEYGLKCDYNKADLLPLKGLPDAAERAQLREVKALANRTVAENHFTDEEKKYILSSLHVFYEAFVFHYRLLKNKGVKRVYFIAHYHNEGLIAACEALNIESIEIQHGLIAPNDLYYVYSEQFREALRNAFFPNKMLMYGTYWRDVLIEGAEYDPQRYVIAGDYLASSTPLTDATFEKHNIVLIGAQKNMEGDYIPYLQSLVQRWKHHDWKIVVKLHPLEKEVAAYQALACEVLEIAAPDARLDDLLRKSKIQVSIYSTTLYDAIGYDVVNLSLQNHGYATAYAADMVHHRVAHALAFDEDPVDRYEQLRTAPIALRERSEIYATFNPAVLA